ncbi:beta-ketoacyl synthase N-terminal-like domain-containing protein [Paenibacillus sp. sgz500958]|uniref:beta-ketoacyl synthase N-terminal-like domain-containing protein n=1 Tax=Paenibacillus sp. sgz500958 TaxID=3242475 RepID=UPI0036D25A1B
MNDMVRLIFEQVLAGTMEQDAATRMLELLKQHGSPQTRRSDIAVIGLSFKLPQSNDLEQFWDHIRSGRELIHSYPGGRRKDSAEFIKHFTSLEEEQIRFSPGGFLDEVDKFDYDFFNLSPKEAALMDPNQRLFLETAWAAIEDAGYGGSRLAGSATGVYLGYADWPVYGQYISKTQAKDIMAASAGNTPSLIASRISYLLDLKGPAFLVDTACSSSLVAVHLACQALADKECEMAIAGGVKVCLMPVDGVFDMGIESSDRSTRAFDDNSDGTVWGEGTVALLLKPLADAQRDRDRIYAVIKGSAINQDGASVGITAPNAAAQEKVLVKAWEKAGIDPETIRYIEAHGTGTRLGDPIEVDGIRRAFRNYTDRNQFCAIGSVKTNIGHLDSAAGIAGLVKAIAALRYKELPPTINFARPNRQIPFESSPVYVNDRTTPWESEGSPRRCGVSSFGFSGTNCHVLLEEAPEPEKVGGVKSQPYQIIALSAKSLPALEELLTTYFRYMLTAESSLPDICYTLNTGRGHYPYRLAFAAAGKEEVCAKLGVLTANGLGSYPDHEIFFGRHQIVTMQRETAKPGQLTVTEMRRLSHMAADMVEAIRQETGGKELITDLCRLYTEGATIGWKDLYQGEPRNKVAAPVYPYQRVRCWLDPATQESNSSAGVALKGRAQQQYSVLEQKIGEVWGQVLGLSEIDIYDDFFELGGNSILAIKAEVELERLQIHLSTTELYQYRSINQAAEYLTRELGDSRGINELEDVNDSCTVHESVKETAAAIYETTERVDSSILPDIEPFNEVFYRNCFYNSMFPVAAYFKGSIMPFLLNDLILYEAGEIASARGAAGYEVRYLSVDPLEQVFERAGFGVDTRRGSSDITLELMQCIDRQQPVVLWVDCYYLSIRKDAYLKEHFDHTLLIYGYDRQQEVFHVIEHDRRENLSYKPRTMPFSDIRSGFSGYMEQFAAEGTPSHYIFLPAGTAVAAGNEDQYRSHFADSIAAGEECIQESGKVLRQFIDDYTVWTASEAALKEQLNELIRFLNDVINAKYVEKYRLTRLLGEEWAAGSLLARIIRNWETVRKGVVRFMYQPVYHHEVFAASAARLTEISEDEIRFYETLRAELADYKSVH